MKWAFAMRVAPQILLAQRVRPGLCGDFTDLPPLASTAATRMPFEKLRADAGYDSEANHRHCREGLGVDSLLPVKKRLGPHGRNHAAAAGDGPAVRQAQRGS
ncbi:transposase [Belnapia sp. T18]|uniref:Transposase n=1 Tax=Belnapia arida TaxID=2804533 RepID=A0ABS1UCA8_9PROT|nr:transposase [Belnapia arida]